jgi:isoquinoline 1-oxidoreductase
MIETEITPVGLSYELSRRHLLKVLGGGFIVAALAPDSLAALVDQRRGPQLPQVVSAWVHIGADGKVTVLTGKVEVGQNARTNVTQAAAEELRVSPDRVEVIMGDTDLVPYDMGTFGSQTTPNMIPQIRRAAASAREALLDLAAQKWSVDKKTLKIENGRVIGIAASAGYGELAKGQPLDKSIDPNIPLTPIAEWKVLGKPVQKVGAGDFVTGKHTYASDVRVPGMLHAKVLRPPSYGAKLASIDTSAAEKMTGVKVVHDGDFVAVAAPTSRQAQKALISIKAEWTTVDSPASKDVFTLLRGTEPIPTPPKVESDKTLTATYTCAYIAHVPLEPRAAVAEWDGKKMTVHTGTQRPFGVKPEVAQALGLEESQVRVIVPDTGAGYGGKHQGDAAVEAAKIAKAINQPVAVVWTRQEEFTFAYFRPGGVDEIYAAVKNDGTIAAWECDNYNSGPPGIETPYDVPNPRQQSHRANSPLRQGSYRCLGATFNNFARETHIDELAHSIGMDPLAFRLKNLTRFPQLKEVLQAAADKFGWDKTKPVPGHGFGIACGEEKGGYIATCAEVSVDNDTKEIRVIRTITAFECGAVLNPELLRNQVEGALIMGMGGALFEAIEFEKGKLLNSRLSKYRVPRYHDIPKIETIIIDRKDLPSAGAGESPILAIAPAIGNAIFNATGTRLRSMPLSLPA